MRYSHQRELILKEVLSRTDHPTAEQICTSLRAVCPRLSLGTVYRDLNTLVAIGKVRRVSIPGEADRFDAGQPSAYVLPQLPPCYQPAHCPGTAGSSGHELPRRQGRKLFSHCIRSV